MNNTNNQDIERLALEFIESLKRFDYDDLARRLSPDLYYRNHPFPGTHTREGGIKQLKLLFTGVKVFNPEILNIASNEDTVLMERYETFEGKFFHISFHVNGILKFRNGKIYEWRDHFDLMSCLISSIKSPFIVLYKFLKNKFF